MFILIFFFLGILSTCLYMTHDKPLWIIDLGKSIILERIIIIINSNHKSIKQDIKIGLNRIEPNISSPNDKIKLDKICFYKYFNKVNNIYSIN